MPTAKTTLATLGAAVLAAVVVLAAPPAAAARSVSTRAAGGGAALAFVPDVGQLGGRASFVAHTAAGAILLSPGEIVLAPRAAGGRALRIAYQGSEAATAVAGSEPLPGTVNYLVGNDPGRWHRDLPTYARVSFRGLYPGIDLDLEGRDGALKAVYTVAPGGDPGRIRWRYHGADRVAVAAAGELAVAVAEATLVDAAPVAWQVAGDGSRRPVAVGYALAGDGTAAFATGDYDPARPLVIDPHLVYSTLIGGSDIDEGRDIAVDAAGNAYIAGCTRSLDMPSAGQPQPGYGGPLGAASFGDAFVAKLDAKGDTLVFLTYLGGSGDDVADAIAIDGAGAVYVTGMTRSANFPVVNAAQPAAGAQGCSAPPCSDAFVAKLTAAGNVLAFSTYLGGSRNENAGLLDTGSRTGALGIALDAGRNVIVTGTTESEDFPVPNGAQTVSGGLADVFVAKLRDDGRALLYGTLLGGGGNEYSGDVAADGFGVAWVTGSTFSGSFPVRDALQPALAGGADAFLARIDTAQGGNASLEYATYLGGTDSDYGMAVALDAAGDAYLAGHTLSLDFPVAGAFQAANGSAGTPSPRDGFLAKVDGSGSTLLYGTYLGGGGVDLAYALKVNAAGQAAVAGRTFSDDFPLRDPWQSLLGGSADAFVAFLDPARSGAASLLYSTYLGGAASDLAYGVAVGGGDAVYLAGSTSGTSGDSLPVTATIGPNGASTGVLVAKLDPRLQYWVPVASRGPGAKGSVWRSDLAIANGGAAAAEVTLRLVSGSKTYTSALPLAATTETMLVDVAGRLAFNGNGAIEVLSTRPLRLASRTYNAVAAGADCYAGGTFGQNYDPATAEYGLRAGESAWLPQLVETPAYRTNLILSNAGRTPAGATVALYNGAGALLKSFLLTVPAGEIRLESQPFLRRAGQGNLTRAFARVWVDSGYGVLASASVIDNLTNDPTTIAMVPAGLESVATWVPVASRASGAKGSLWRTDLGLLNPSTLAAAVTLRFRSGGKVVVNTETVAANSQSILADVVGKLPASGTGSLEVTADRGVVVTSRTYNLIAGTAACFPLGTLGQSYPATEPYAGLAAGETAWLVGLVETPAFRTNITLTNTGPSPATVTVTLFGGTGASLGGYTVTLAAGELKQSNQPFAAIGKQSNLTAGYARVAVTSGSGVVALGSVIDNLTNDPTTVTAQW